MGQVSAVIQGDVSGQLAVEDKIIHTGNSNYCFAI